MPYLPKPSLLAPCLALGLFALAGAGPAAAQETTATPAPTVATSLQKGANSFTEAQVRERLDKAGFHGARDMRKDEDGIWHGTATHAGKEIRVGLDYRGTVAAEP